MATLKSVMAELSSKGSEKTRIIYARHGNHPKQMFGVSVANLKEIAKTIKGQQALALELYDTGNMDAMYLAGMVADGSEMHKQQLQAWAEGASGVPMVSEYTVPWVAVENPHARDLAMEWMASANESVAASGWCTYSGLVAIRADTALDLAEIERLLATIVKRNPYGAKPGSIYDEWVCHRGGNVCETLAETSEGGRSEDRRSFRGRRRDRLQSAAGECVHRQERGCRPRGEEAEDYPVLVWCPM